jgi:parallel beta-helix repeat protein
MYEQSCRNVVAFNSMTHGGDGLFLWAGQQTMDTGVGGANDNLFYENDFSFAPTNGMEATFSRNVFARNRIAGSDHGLWGGYSFDSRVVDNDFMGNRIGIAIEHGQNNTIAGNRFTKDGTAIQLWASPIEPSDWGYPKHRDTRSVGYHIERNAIEGEHVALRVSETRESVIANNQIVRADTQFFFKDTAALTLRDNVADATVLGSRWPRPKEGATDIGRPPPTPISGARSAFGDSLAARDRSAIVVGEWGPFDWRSPLLWPVDSSRRSPLPLRVLGPRGAWRVVGRRGVLEISKDHGAVGDTIIVTPAADKDDWQIDLEYRGVATVSPSGQARPAGAPYRFSYGRFTPPLIWDVQFMAWSDSIALRNKPDVLRELVTQPGVITQRVPRLDYMWYAPTVPGVPRSKFAIVATTSVMLEKGEYTLQTISDDAVRVWVDGKLAIDNWTPHESMVDTAQLQGGKHELRVEYYQIGGWTELRVEILKGFRRVGGSPGPH